jgi:hypothetical protein
MQLENMMEIYQPRVSETRHQTYFVVGDLESMSASALYGGDKPIIKDWGMIIPLKINEIPMHETYNIDKEGNVSNGHSTVNLPNGGKVYMPYGSGKPSIKRGS